MGRYKFDYSETNKIICTFTFAKQEVKGIAKCSPEDGFNFKIVSMLAQLRCDDKVSKKRLVKARKRYDEAVKCWRQVNDELTQASHYLIDSANQYKEATTDLEVFEKLLKNT